MKDIRNGQMLVNQSNSESNGAQLAKLRLLDTENARHDCLISIVYQTNDYAEDSILDLQNAFRKLQSFVIAPNAQNEAQLEYTGDKIVISDVRPNAYAFLREYAGIIGCKNPASVHELRRSFSTLSFYDDIREDGESFAKIAWQIIEKLQEIVTINK